MLIQKYDPIWSQNFEDLKNKIQKALVGLYIKIEHVGSTSVIGLAAKPIIDIDIIYYQSSDFEKIKTGLSNIGYYHNGNQGIPQREVFKRRESLEESDVLDILEHHLYACPINSEELRRHILFRDFLRKNDWAKKEYEKLKFELAGEVNQDRKKYAELKEIRGKEFIQSIIDQAKNNDL